MPRVDFNTGESTTPKRKRKSTKTKKVENLTIHDVYVLDASSSMGDPKNEYNKAYKAIHGCYENLQASFANKEVKTKATVCIFSYTSNISFPYVLSTKLPTLNKIQRNWSRGMTALYDAIGETISTLNINIKEEDKVNIKIFTDGNENNSRRYGSRDISNMIKKCESKGWTIAFIGTPEDVTRVQNNLSIHESNTLTYDGSAEGFEKTMQVTRGAMANYSASALAGEDTTLGFFSKEME